MLKSTHRDAIAVTQSAEVWRLTRNGQTHAVIERAWDDHHWLLFLADDTGELAYRGTVGRITTLKTFLTMWARRDAKAFPFHIDEQPEQNQARHHRPPARRLVMPSSK